MTDRRLRGIKPDRRGVATIEFALWSALILGTLLPCLDFGMYLIQKGKLSSAVGQASIIAYNMRSGGAIDTGQLSTYVAGASGLPAAMVTPSIQCNGGAQACSVAATDRVCACPTLSGAVTYTPTQICGAPCASGGSSGYYLTVSARVSYRSFIANPWMNNHPMTSATTVRLQ